MLACGQTTGVDNIYFDPQLNTVVVAEAKSTFKDSGSNWYNKTDSIVTVCTSAEEAQELKFRYIKGRFVSNTRCKL